jgi:thiamine-monophosphate kinase
VIDVVVVGTVDPGRALRRDRGRPGDLLVVTGCLGGAAAGLRLLLDGRREPIPVPGGHRHAAEGHGQGPQGYDLPLHGRAHSPAEVLAATDAEAGWLGRQLRPRTRLAEGQALVRLGVACAGDLSDGLIVDVGRITDASGCAAEIWLDSVPTEPGIRTLLGAAWVDAALGGGEDFELVAAVAAERLDGLLARWPGGLAPLQVVGRLTPGSGLRLLDRRDGQDVPLPPVASRHFRQP